MKRKTEVETEISGKELIKNLISDSYKENSGILRNLTINFIHTDDVDKEFQKILELLCAKGLSGIVTSLKVNSSQRFDANQLTSLAGIGQLTALTSLHVGGNRLTSLEGIEQLTALTSLHVGANQLTSLEGIEQLTALTSLHVGANQLTSLASIEQLTALRTLDVTHNQLTSLEGIEQLTALRSLYVGGNQLTSLAGIEQLTALRTLDVSHNQLISLASLPPLPALESLEAAFNPLTKLSINLGNCTSLKSLKVEFNQLQAGTPRTIEKLKAQFLKLQQAYRSNVIAGLINENLSMIPPGVNGIITEYDDRIESSVRDELANLSTEEIAGLEETIFTPQRDKNTKSQKKADDLKLIADLHEALENNDFETFRQHLSKAKSLSVDLNTKTGDAHDTLLHTAVFHAPEFTRLLLENGANPNLMNNNLYTPVSIAAVRGYHDVLAVYQRHTAQAAQGLFVPITLETWEIAEKRYKIIENDNPNNPELNYKEVREILNTVLRNLGIVLEQPASQSAPNTTTSATPSPVIIHTPNGRPISPIEENEKTPSSMKKKSTP